MALSGDHVVVKMDDAGGTLRTFAAGDITSVDLGMTFDQIDVTGFGDEVHKMINGQLQAPVTLKGHVTTTADIGTHPVIQSAFAAGAQVTLAVTVGNNAPPQAGDPEYSGEFLVSSYKPMIENGKAVTFEALLNPATGAAPDWGSMS